MHSPEATRRLECPAPPAAGPRREGSHGEPARHAALIARVLEGDTESFRPLVEAFEMAVFGLCRRLLGGSESEAEDLCQETFVQAFRYLPTLEDRTRFGPWLYQIARSLCRSHRRRRALERRVLAAEAVSLRWREGSSRAGQAGDADQAAEALAELPAPEREALELRYFEGLSYGEIAARTGLSFSRVDHLIRKARARLRRRFKVREERARTL